METSEAYRRSSMPEEHAALESCQPFRSEQRIGIRDDVADAESAIELVERWRPVRARNRELQRRGVVRAPRHCCARAEEVFVARRLPVVAAGANDQRQIGPQREFHPSVQGFVLLLNTWKGGRSRGSVDGVSGLVDVRSRRRASAPISTSAAFQVRIHCPPPVTKSPGMVWSFVNRSVWRSGAIAEKVWK